MYLHAPVNWEIDEKVEEKPRDEEKVEDIKGISHSLCTRERQTHFHQLIVH